MHTLTRERALVVLADGTFFEGHAWGALRPEPTFGEVVFNTSMSGYQEVITDPSYHGQLVTMTSPHIGNYGVNPWDMESERAQLAGLIVREASRMASSWRATATLPDWMRDQGVPCITGVDTRALTRHVRDHGAQMGALVTGVGSGDVPGLVELIRRQPHHDTLDHVAMVSTRVQQRAVLLDTGDPMAPHTVALHPWQASDASASNETPWVGVVDFGVKRSILRHLLLQGLQVRVFPHDVRPDVLLSSGLRGVLLSNGPGDPARMDAAVEMIRGLLGQLPLMGICLGHQLLGRALGGETWKLRFGHRGPNQPVLDEASRRVQITAQNHGFAVRLATGGGAVQSHRNLNDQTCEGLRVESMRILSVQHHPEAAPGPHDATVEFANFARWLQTAA